MIIIVKVMSYELHRLSYKVPCIKYIKLYINMLHLLINPINKIIDILINKWLNVIILYDTILQYNDSITNTYSIVFIQIHQYVEIYKD